VAAVRPQRPRSPPVEVAAEVARAARRLTARAPHRLSPPVLNPALPLRAARPAVQPPITHANAPSPLRSARPLHRAWSQLAPRASTSQSSLLSVLSALAPPKAARALAAEVAPPRHRRRTPLVEVAAVEAPAALLQTAAAPLPLFLLALSPVLPQPAAQLAARIPITPANAPSHRRSAPKLLPA
jgi:hypothetical protein